MRILITGANGQLGSEIQEVIKKGVAEIGEISENIKKSKVIACNREELDITKLSEVKKKLKELRPDVIINCAAATNVDGCEINKEFAFSINALGARNLAMVSNEIMAKLVHISTDYVFDGNVKRSLTEFDLPSPYNIYGKTKFAGENFVREFSSRYFIIRTSWLYGYKGSNFIFTMRRLAKENDEINVVNDQTGNPTNANDLVYHILKLIETEEYGVYHCTGNEECTWYEFAQTIIKLSKEKCIVNPCTSEEFKTLAKRPKYSSLDNMMLRCTIGDDMRNWKDAIKTFINNLDTEKCK